VVRNGEKIDMRFQKGMLEIVLPGLAREDGALGEEIRVKCIETKKIFEGRVINAETVYVKL
jgi:flagella basal body P-ring formation protein FlgA